jgi:hypothetical protein
MEIQTFPTAVSSPVPTARQLHRLKRGAWVNKTAVLAVVQAWAKMELFKRLNRSADASRQVPPKMTKPRRGR